MLLLLAEVRTSVAELRLCWTGDSFKIERSIGVVDHSLDLRVKFLMGRLDGKASAFRDESLGQNSQSEVAKFLKTAPIL